MKFLLKGWVMVGLAFSLLTSCSRYVEGPVTDHFDGKRFFNPGKPHEVGFFDFLKWKFTADRGPWPNYSELRQYDSPPERVYGSKLRVSYIGHATVLLQTSGVNVLVDPVWSKRVSPVSFAGPIRVHPPGVDFEKLPPVDVVLVSHSHYDHLDLDTLSMLWQRDKPRIIVPLGNDKILSSYQRDLFAEAYDWGDKVDITKNLTIHIEPMHHWSARGVADRNKALWAAYVFSTEGGNIYFIGDSGYGEGDNFRAAREKFGSFRLAILPIGCSEPNWFMKDQHMSPAQALLAYEDLGKPQIIPTHHSIFPLADNGYGEPLETLNTILSENKRGKVKDDFLILNAGEHMILP